MPCNEYMVKGYVTINFTYSGKIWKSEGRWFMSCPALDITLEGQTVTEVYTSMKEHIIVSCWIYISNRSDGCYH